MFEFRTVNINLHVVFFEGARNADLTIVQPPLVFHDLMPDFLYEIKEESGAAFFGDKVVSGTKTFSEGVGVGAGVSVALVIAGIGVVVAKSLEILIGEPLDTMVTVGFGDE